MLGCCPSESNVDYHWFIDFSLWPSQKSNAKSNLYVVHLSFNQRSAFDLWDKDMVVHVGLAPQRMHVFVSLSFTFGYLALDHSCGFN